MILGALIDAGVDSSDLELRLKSMTSISDQWRLNVSSVCKSSGRIRATQVEVEVYQQQMEHRNFNSIKDIINSADSNMISQVVKSYSIQVFHQLALAEASVHGSTIEAVHFHEVGAIDSIVDTVGVVLGLYLLGVHDHIYCSSIPLTSGCVRSQHGMIPIPAPATLHLLQGHFVCHAAHEVIKGETVTPTAASLLRVLVPAERSGCWPKFKWTIEASGSGAGSRNPQEYPNICRVIIGWKVAETSQKDSNMSSVHSGDHHSHTETNHSHGNISNDQQQLQHGHSHIGDHHSHAETNHSHGNISNDQQQLQHGHSHIGDHHSHTETNHSHGNISNDQQQLQHGHSHIGDHHSHAETNHSLREKFAPKTREQSDDLSENVTQLYVVETNVDDMSPEIAGYTMEKLLSENVALDVWFEHIQMKKNRPGFKICILCEAEQEDNVCSILFAETTTLGVRRYAVSRRSLNRRFEKVQCYGSSVNVKLGISSAGGILTVSPEYECCRAIARRTGNVPIKTVMETVKQNFVNGK